MLQLLSWELAWHDGGVPSYILHQSVATQAMLYAELFDHMVRSISILVYRPPSTDHVANLGTNVVPVH